MTNEETRPGLTVALYRNLADAEAALIAVQEAGVQYHSLQMNPYSTADINAPELATRLPERFWAIVLPYEESQREAVNAALRGPNPFSVGHTSAPDGGRTEGDQGTIAWGHYVFDSPAATDAVGDSAGTSGVTGITSSGAFATGTENVREPEKL